MTAIAPLHQPGPPSLAAHAASLDAARVVSAAAGRILAGVVSLNPSSSALPGASAVEQLTNGVGWWALIASLVGLVIGAAAWAIGSHGNNYQYATTGRRAVLVSGAAALVIGAAPTLVNFLFATGHGIH